MNSAMAESDQAKLQHIVKLLDEGKVPEARQHLEELRNSARSLTGYWPEPAKQRGEPWQGVADAVQHANEVFDSVEKRNERGKSSDEKQYERDKKALELRKEQALANLRLQKRGITKTQYEFARSGIENFYLQQESAEAERSEDHKLARKEKYQKDLTDQSSQDAERAMRLPENRREAAAQMNALPERADPLGKTTEKHHKNTGEQGDAPGVQGGGVMDNHGARPGAVKVPGTDGRSVEVERRKAAREQDQLSQKAAKEAGEAATAYDELYSRGGDADQRREDSQFRQYATRQKIQVNMTKALAEEAEHGAQIAEGLDALHRANVNNFNLVIAKMNQQAAEMEALRRRLIQNRSQMQALPSQQY